jgi:hypothetical protein
MISNTFNFFPLTLKNRPIRWRTLYLSGRIFGCIWVAAEDWHEFRFNVIIELVNEC